MLLLPVAAYLVMDRLIHIIPPSGDFKSLFYYSIVILILLVTPYVVLKFLFHAAHIKNKKEPELNLQDLPKAQEKTNSRKVG